MNPMRTSRTILFVLPYVLVVTGILVAGEKASSSGGATGATQALAVAAIGALWACVRAHR